MTDSADDQTSAMDQTLLARMIGKAGDRRTLEGLGNALAECAGPMFESSAGDAIGFPIATEFEEFDVGTRSELVAGLDVNTYSAKAGIAGWCDSIILAGNNVFFMALLEGMLGGNLPDGADIEPRELSPIERDVSTVVFKQFAEAIKSVVESPPTGAVTIEPMAEDTESADETGSIPSVLLKFVLTAGEMDSPLTVILPQRALLKATISEPAEAPPPEQPEWMEQLSNQVTNSHVILEANIALSDSTLGEIARLQPGDVLPFADEGQVRTLLKASGKEIFWCEFGKAGNRYTVRVLEAHEQEQELIRELISG